MSAEKKIRKQIYLEPEQNRQIKIFATRTEKTEAEIIREAVNQYLTDKGKVLEDPLLELIGMVKNGVKDGSTSHDRDIYLIQANNTEDTHEKR